MEPSDGKPRDLTATRLRWVDNSQRDGSTGSEIRRASTATVGEAALYLNVSAALVRKLVLERKIPYVKIGRLVRLRWADLDAYVESSIVEPTR